MRKFKKFGIICFLLIIFINTIVLADSKTISANDIVKKFGKNWEERYNSNKLSLTRESMNKVLGKMYWILLTIIMKI